MYTVEDDSLTSIADSIRKKAKKTGTLTFPADFVSVIDGIETGGGSTPAVIEEAEEKDVNFYDYDGVRVFSYTAAEAAALTELPTPSARTGLTFQGWNWTIDEVKAAAAADIGANYTTEDGKTRLYIRISNQPRKDLILNFWQSKASAVSVDWGDGSAAETSETAGDTQLSHEYAKCGEYTITLSVTDGATAGLGHDYPYGQVFSGAGVNPDSDTYKSNIYTNALLKAELGASLVYLHGHCFDGCENLESVNTHTAIARIAAYAFSDCRRLSWVTMIRGQVPNNYAFSNNGLKRAPFSGNQRSSGSSEAYKNNNVMTRAVYPPNITSILQSEFYNCLGLSEVIFLGNVKNIATQAFSGDYSLKTVSFLNCTAVPTLASYRALEKTSSDLEILVPAALADEWKAATNWSTYANQIKGA